MTVISRSAASALDTRLRTELWLRIEQRLADGETLATGRHFQSAIESAYRDFTGQVPPAQVRERLRRLVRDVNAERPDTYLARGVQNAVRKAFAHGVENLHWDPVRVQRHGSASIRRFLRRSKIRGFLHEIRLDPDLINVYACVRAADTLAGPLLDAETVISTASTPHKAAALPPLPSPFLLDEADELDGPGEGGRGQAVDPLVADGPPSLQLFDGLQNISGEYDGLMRTLIQHKELVVGGDEGDRTRLMTALMGSPGFLQLSVAAMERRDPEMRKLSERLPPYDQALEKLQSKDALKIEESFVDDLRRLSPADYEQKLESKDDMERTRAMTDVNGLIHLLDQLMEATPFRRKVRLLIGNRVLQGSGSEIESIYRAGASVAVSRAKAEVMLRQKLEPVFVDASTEEEEAVRKRSQALLMSMEQKLVAEVDAEADEVMDTLRRAGATSDSAGATDPAEEEELTEIEKSRGALLTQVAVRVDGRPQTISGVVMPDPDDSKRMVLAERDPESGELVAQKRKRRLRYVNQLPDGSWQALTG